MNRAGSFLTGLAVGAGLMYVLDPDRGRRRRALVRDRAARGLHLSQDFLGKAGRDLRHRAQGVAASARHRVSHEIPPDDVLAARVRSKMGRYVSHPHAIETIARHGHVTLRGPILAEELSGLLSAIRTLHGVTGVENQLEPHTRDENIPALQGGLPTEEASADGLPSEWSPGMQLVGTIIAGAAVLYGTRLAMSRRGAANDDEKIDTEASLGESLPSFEEARS